VSRGDRERGEGGWGLGNVREGRCNRIKGPAHHVGLLAWTIWIQVSE
jgi:hypothetical protein